MGKGRGKGRKCLKGRTSRSAAGEKGEEIFPGSVVDVTKRKKVVPLDAGRRGRIFRGGEYQDKRIIAIGKT